MAQCPFPMTIKNKNFIYGVSLDYSHHMVPCGKCPICYQNRANAWSFRIQAEMKDALDAHFITLTYDTPPRSYNDLFTLRKGDLQGYFKRLREREGHRSPDIPPIKYYAAGEYGEEFQRPHYHAIILNVRNERNLTLAWTNKDKIIGYVDIGTVTPASISYVTGYIGKKIGIPWTDYDDRLPEFSLMSKKMGVNYLQYATRYHKDNNTLLTRMGPTKMALPRYLRDKIFEKHELKIIQYEQEAIKWETENRITDSLYSPEDIAMAKAEAFKQYEQKSGFIRGNLS